MDEEFFIYHSWYISSFESVYKKRPSIKAIFSDVILVSNYRDSKGEIPYDMVDILFTKL